jgi:AraC-like DNA-binding protein
MQNRQYSPHPVLSDYVQCLWTSERDFFPPLDVLDVLPDSFIELIFSSGARCWIDDRPRARDMPRCYLVGMLDQPFRLRADGPVQTVAARFFAWGLHPLLGRAIKWPPNGTHDLDACWPDLAAQIAQAVRQDDGDLAVGHLHDFLVAQALCVQLDQNALQAARLLLSQQGQVKIRDLADSCHVSRRQLERTFRAVVGSSPKALARKMRFEHARDHLWRTPDCDLATLAHSCGYADQAHFTREFKRFSHRTPGQFVAEMRATREVLRAYGVAFVQDIRTVI